MSKQTVNIGAAPNDGTGDTLRDAFDKINDNTDGMWTRVVSILVTDPNGDAITAGNGKAYLPITSVLAGRELTAVRATLTTVSSSGTVSVQVRRNRAGVDADMLTTNVTIDVSEASSASAATPAVINTGNDDVADDDFVYIDIDLAGTGAKGLAVTLHFS